jgi:spore germination cell wall hydrolase CwlJ-like protein
MIRFFIVVILVLISFNTAQAEWFTWTAPKPDPKQLQCMATAIYHEAGNESDLGRIAVGKVIMNRVNSGLFPDNICGVVYQRAAGQCQFVFACVKSMKVTSQEQYARSLASAELVMLGFHPDVSNGAIAFNNRPFRDKRLVKVAQIGGHYFYRRI